MSAVGTLTLFIDMKKVGQGPVMTQPGMFGEGLSIGSDSGAPVSPDYAAPFLFTGGVIERVIVDVSGEHYIDHEKEVTAWLLRD